MTEILLVCDCGARFALCPCGAFYQMFWLGTGVLKHAGHRDPRGTSVST